MSTLLEKYSEVEILAAAAMVMESRVRAEELFTTPQAVKDFVRFKIGAEEREHFMVMFLNSQNRLIHADVMFSGTVNQTSVYPREVVKSCLQHNASAIVIAHNHPSGYTEPSSADLQLTQTLKTCVNLVDVRILDHIIVGLGETYSFAERGLI